MAVITVTAAEKTLRRPFPMQDCDDTSAMSDEQNGGNGRKLTMQYLWLKGCLGKEVVNPKKGKCETNRRQALQLGKISNLARLGQFCRFPYLLSLLLLMILAQAASATHVSETECEKISLNDITLDADEVRRVMKNNDRECNFSSRGYTIVSDDAFHHVSCEVIYLSYNNISHLPEYLFSRALRLREIYLTGNRFCEAPVIKNAVVETIILDQNPVMSIPENFTDYLPNLRVMSLKNCTFPFEINVRAFNCSCVKNSIQIYLNGTVTDLILSCPEHVMVTTEEGHYTPSVTVTCSNGNHVTFVSPNRTVWNETVATTTETTSDLRTPYLTLPSVISTPETPTDSQNFASKQVMSFIGVIVLVICISVIGLRIFCKFKGSCKQQRNFESGTPMNTMDKGQLVNGVHAAVDLELLI